MGIGGFFSAYGQLIQGEAERDASYLNARQAEQNAVISLEQSAEEERRLRVQGQKVLGDMRASYGASGVTMEGSPMEVLKASAGAIELDALNIRTQGQNRYNAFRQEARMSRMRGEAVMRASQFGAAASALDAGVSAYLLGT